MLFGLVILSEAKDLFPGVLCGEDSSLRSE